MYGDIYIYIERERQKYIRLFKAIEKSFGADRGIVFKKRSRTITFKDKLLARIECESFEKFEVLWIAKTIVDAKIDKPAILEDFFNHTGIAAGANWVA